MARDIEEVFDRYPQLRITRDNIEYLRGLLDRRLLVNRCQACGYWIYPHRPMCPECWSTAVEPTEVSGRGHVYMFTILHQGRVGYGFEYPHVKAAVELAEQPGLRYLAPIFGCRPEDVRGGMPVTLTWVEGDGYPIAAFEPTEAQPTEAQPTESQPAAPRPAQSEGE